MRWGSVNFLFSVELGLFMIEKPTNAPQTALKIAPNAPPPTHAPSANTPTNSIQMESASSHAALRKSTTANHNSA